MEKTRIIIVGRGGSGKNFLMGRMVERGMVPGILFTSRPPREGEVDGVDYNFRSPDLFEFAHEEFYDLEMYNGWYYGILKKQFKKNDVFIMTPSGVSKIDPKDRANCFIIYLNPPREIIQERLEQRNGMKDSVERRMLADDEDFRDFTDYDLLITNPYF